MNLRTKTVATALKQATKTFQASPISQAHARLEAEVLLCEILHKEKSWLYAYPESEISEILYTQYIELLTRRLNGEPVSQIITQKEFYSRNFFVNKSVLTPRPETEGLIDLALKYLGSKAEIIDLGTGSGAIAITLALEAPEHADWEITAIDNSEQALSVARINEKQLLPSRTINFLKLDYLRESLPGKYDLILANPPYIPSDQITDLSIEVREYEPREALDGGRDGMEYYKKIAQILKFSLKAKGVALLELHHETAEKTRAIFASEYDSVILQDYAGLNRYLVIKN